MIVTLYETSPSRNFRSEGASCFSALYKPHLVRKQIAVRALCRIKDNALVEDMDRFNIDHGCVDVDIMIERYDKFLSDLLDKHAPNKNIYLWIAL